MKALYKSYLDKGYWEDVTHGELLKECADKYKDKVAVTDDMRTLSFRELDSRSDKYAAYFLSIGLKKGECVIMQHVNTVSFAEITFALLKIGVVLLPVMPSYKENELNGIIELSGPAAYIVVDEHMGYSYKPLADQIAKKHPGIRHMIYISSLEELDLDSYCLEDMQCEKVTCTDSAVIVTSSGSTGAPKLIEKNHANYIHSQKYCAKSFEMTDKDINLVAMSLTHNWNLCGPGMLGSTLLGCTTILGKYGSPDEIIELIEKYEVTSMALVPSLMKACIEFRKYDSSNDISSLKVIQAGGSICSAELVSDTMKVLNCVVQQIYGMGEGFVSATSIHDNIDIITSTQGFPVSPGDEFVLVNTAGKSVPDGQSGELLVRGLVL